jgi:aquaporin Z
LPAGAAEFYITFALVWVVLNVGFASDRGSTTMGPLAIGLVVLAGFISVGDIYRAAFNPAVALSIALTRTVEWVDLAVYLAAQLGGAAVAAVAFDHLQPETEEPTADDALQDDTPVASRGEEPAGTGSPLI